MVRIIKETIVTEIKNDLFKLAGSLSGDIVLTMKNEVKKIKNFQLEAYTKYCHSCV